MNHVEYTSKNLDYPGIVATVCREIGHRGGIRRCESTIEVEERKMEKPTMRRVSIFIK